jgi:DNA-binding beta-propeller fold protein YncE
VRPGLRTGGILFAAIVAGVLVAAVRGVLRAGVGASSADRVLGQIDFVRNQVNFVDAIGMNAPAGVAIDKSNGHVIVADSQNNRVLGWKSASAFASGGAADLVIGQPDFNSSGCN